jgi:carbon storage regulator
MLVLSRQEQQRIMIGNQIVVTVVRVSRGGVRLGIEAPRNVRVVREELLSRGPQGEPLGARQGAHPPHRDTTSPGDQ